MMILNVMTKKVLSTEAIDVRAFEMLHDFP